MPSSKSASGPPPSPRQLSLGVERVLTRAADDDAFHEDLKTRGVAAAMEAGIELTAAERRVLEAIAPAQLDAMVHTLAGRKLDFSPEVVFAPAGIRPDSDPVRGNRACLPVALAAGAVVVGGAGATLLITAGSRPDDPPQAPTVADNADGGPDAGDGGTDP